MVKSKKKGGCFRRYWYAALTAAVCAAAVAGCVIIKSSVYKECIVEAGGKITASDFVRTDGEEACFVDVAEPVATDTPGSYSLRIRLGAFQHKVVLTVRDTVPPEASVVEQSVKPGERLEAENFVKDVTDATRVDIRYESEPDYSRFGRQEVRILLEDAGGNVTVLTSQLLISRVREEVTVEAGSGLPAADEFLLTEAGECTYDMQKAPDTGSVGSFPVKLLVDGEVYESVLKVEDTTAPEGEVMDLAGFTPLGRKAEEFIVPDSIRDATAVTVTYKKEPDMSREGTQEVILLLTDEGGNTALKTAWLTLKADREKPVIHGAVGLSTVCGYGISYKKNVYVTDNSGEEIEVKVDASAVNLEETGSYPVIYSAVDASGNEARVKVTLAVHEKTFDMDELYAKADEVLADITDEGMSGYDKAYAIFNWVKRNVMYVDHASKDVWEQGAYDGLVRRRGDCYTYAMTSKLLLTQAGIENRDIAKIPTSSRHYWNAVNLGDGWLHFDTTPRTDHSIIFLWTDEQLSAYMGRHYRSHNYDRSVYTMFDEAGAAESPSDSYGQSLVSEAKAARQKAEEEAAAQEAGGNAPAGNNAPAEGTAPQ